MKGTSHAIVGAGAGLGVAVWQEAAPAATGLLILLGSVSSLAPDLDTNGKLSNRISLHRKWLWFALACLGVLLGTYSLIILSGIVRILGVGAALLLILLPRYLINQRFMVLLSGITLIGTGWLGNEYWLILFGLFTAGASFVPHRGPTHSLAGAAVFIFIAYQLENRMAISGIAMACAVGYISHLILDMKCLPFNKKGVKWFLPLYNREF
ncbi:metal-dependent hydrolase [Jeotgalibacillus sp. ET6]|uniref:metal-dependent hydrolase n=1 Tax=Jeotgalibacillus sp. ET6 TaxID=3037260 RepID=UPI0024181A75|nr:metal-dependent hydrolase [Jeotgalibacillus sp. ET6]MDG5470450.1 metal-dependent hydrolase [Jeotgalibacillus sp. ET6]